VASLTRDEAETRAQLIQVRDYTLDLDLTRGERFFGSTVTIRFGCTQPGASSFVEVEPAVLHRAVLNGRPLDLKALENNRLPLWDLAAENELTVVAEMAYSHTGEGMHRYVDPVDGEVYTYTQCFLDDTRRVFASFDQPDLKAPFTVSLTVPSQWTVVGNGAATQVAPGRWRLATTPPLSTYFLAVAAGPFHSVHSEHDGIPLGLYCRRSLAPYLDADVDELFEITRACLDEYHRMFQIRYPFGKYDQVFVPEFNAGAMENPGCVTIRDEYVFQSAVTNTQRQERAEVIAHEMAHMWFGDLVTMRWWDDLWLNESFAEYMGHEVTERVTRFTGSWTTFAVLRKYWGYAADQRPSTHPVAGDVSDAAHALLNFDGISYAKGASILRQLVAWLGEETFLRGIRDYFTRHRFSNATLNDLLDALSQASGRDLTDWAKRWLRTCQVNTLRPEYTLDDDGRFATFAVVQTAPPEHPTLRPHRIAIGGYAQENGSLVRRLHTLVALDPDVGGGRTPVSELIGVPAPELTVLNDGDLTFAKIRLDDRSWQTTYRALSRVADPLTRALLWGAAWDATRDADLPADQFIDLVVAHLPHETEVSLWEASFTLARNQAVDRYLPVERRPEALAALAAVCRRVLADTDTADGRRLAAARGLAACAVDDQDIAVVRRWLVGDEVPAGITVDTELRWMILYRLAVLGLINESEIEQELTRDPSAMGQRGAARARAARPDPDAKQQAWDMTFGPQEPSNHLLMATLEGFWQPEQADLLTDYVERYFDEVVRLQRRTHTIQYLIGQRGFPWIAVEQATLDRAYGVLEREDLPPSVRRSLADQTDDLRRALQARRAVTRSTRSL